MHVTYQMIISELSAHLDVENCLRTANPAFRGVEIYTGADTQTRVDILYVAPLDVAAGVDGERPLSFLCTCGDTPLPR